MAIRGLRNHVELNGCIAKVAECHDESQRYEVHLARLLGKNDETCRMNMMRMTDLDGNYGEGLIAMDEEGRSTAFSFQVRALDSGQLFRVKKARGKQEENQQVHTK